MKTKHLLLAFTLLTILGIGTVAAVAMFNLERYSTSNSFSAFVNDDDIEQKGDRNYYKTTVNLDGQQITGLDISNIFNVEVYYGTTPSVEIEISALRKADVMDLIKKGLRASFNGGVVYLGYEGKLQNTSRQGIKFNAKVTCSDLNLIKLSGASNVDLMDNFSLSGNLTLKASGAADFDAKKPLTIAQTLYIECSGASDVDFVSTNSSGVKVRNSGASNLDISGGSTTNLDIDVSGASSTKLSSLKADNCSVESSGASNVKVHAVREMSVKTSGASNVAYSGQPTLSRVSKSGASSLTRN